MNLLPESDISCPYCGEQITILLDDSIEQQQYIEDCQVCCRPIVVHVTAGPDGAFRVDARHEDE